MILETRLVPVLLLAASALLPGCAVKDRNFGAGAGNHSGAGGSHPGGGGDMDASTGGAGGSEGGSGGALPTGGNAGTAGNAMVVDGGGDAGDAGSCAGKVCPTGQSCKAGACVDNPCTPNKKFCLNGQLKLCNADLSSTLIMKCGAGDYCDDTALACKKQNCSPGTATCAGTQPQLCPLDGSHYQNNGAACAGKEPNCDASMGVCTCTPGLMRCAPDKPQQPQICSTNNTWVNNGASCSSAVYDHCDEDTGDAFGHRSACVTKSVPIEFGIWERTVRQTDNSVRITNTRVEQFRLDTYEVTVGQFRRFVNAWINRPNGSLGYRPSNGDGKHLHVNSGNGLVNALQNDDMSTSEPGWINQWSTYLPTKLGSADATDPGFTYYLTYTGDFKAPSLYATWTPAEGLNDNKPINLVNWYEAYAYCIWDGGFLPSAAEWQWAAQGGSVLKDGDSGGTASEAARLYPWGDTPAPTKDYAVYNCLYPTGTSNCVGIKNIADVDQGPADKGISRWGNVHMAGNVWEWVLDWHKGPDYIAPAYPQECNNCARLDPNPPANPQPLKMDQGGDFYFDADKLKNTNYRLFQANFVDHYGGFRCARSPQ